MSEYEYSWLVRSDEKRANEELKIVHSLSISEYK